MEPERAPVAILIVFIMEPAYFQAAGARGGGFVSGPYDSFFEITHCLRF